MYLRDRLGVPCDSQRSPSGSRSSSRCAATRANVEHQHAEALDLVIDEGLDPQALHPFKGNLDPAKLDRTIRERGREHVPLVMLTVTNNSGGGQPVSIDNVKRVREVCDRHG